MLEEVSESIFLDLISSRAFLTCPVTPNWLVWTNVISPSGFTTNVTLARNNPKSFFSFRLFTNFPPLSLNREY